MLKIFNGQKLGDKRTINLFGFPLYMYENTSNSYVKEFLGGFISINRNKSKIKDLKTFRVFNKTVYVRMIEDDFINYYFSGKLVKKVSLTNLFYKKYLKKVKYTYDDVYILDCNSGEIYLFLAYIAKAFLKKNNSQSPLFVATKKYHVDILKIYYPNAKYIFVPKSKLKTKSSYWKINGHQFFMLFSSDYFGKIEKDIKYGEINSVHYFDRMLEYLGLTRKDCTASNITIPTDDQKSLYEKVNKLGLNLNNFIILAPEALTCEEIEYLFWQNLADELLKRNFDVYINVTCQNLPFKNCKNTSLNYREVLFLAQKAKAVISLRSGLSEFLLSTEIPNITIYTKFRDRGSSGFSVDKGIAGFSMAKIPFVKKENIIELNYENFINYNELVNKILKELENLNVLTESKKKENLI